MSFILDALRKSEHARGGRALPGLVGQPVSRPVPSRLPLLLAGIGALLLVNVVVLAIVLLRPAAPAANPSAPPATPAALPATPAALPATPAALPATPPVLPAAPPATATAGPEHTRPLDEEAGDAAGVEPEAAPEPVIRPAGGTAEAAPRVPTLNDLPAESTSGLPHLNIDLHVWSGDARQRFVVINGQRAHEGTALREGATVERITQDGVILTYHGTHFLLPRQ